jgi:hypothetical protein
MCRMYMPLKQSFFLFALCIVPRMYAYTLPTLGLGSSSFLDGGPLRQIPGWYWQTYSQFYTTHRFLDNQGELLFGIPSPRLNAWTNALQFIYLSQKDFLGLGNWGFDITIPAVFYSHIEKNDLGITNSGSGFGDLILGMFAQAEAIMRGEDPLYVQRLEFAISFPTGKNKRPFKNINPGNGVYFIDPYWAATLYFTPRFSASWRVHYLWVSHNHRLHIKAGDAIHGTYALEYAITPDLYLGINGYFLQQIGNNKFEGVIIPDSKERVFAIGVGGLYSIERRFAFVVIANLYFETAVRNRTQGIKAFLRVLKHF